MNETISMFIDNELSIQEKQSFVKRLGCDPGFFSETLALIEQEQLLQAEGLFDVPAMNRQAIKTKRIWIQDLFMDFFRPLLQPAGVMAVLAVLVLIVAMIHMPPPGTAVCPSRLVVYQPEATDMAVAGTFTAWQPVPMHPAGSSGYWEITLAVPGGEHQFVYIADGQRRFVDPTVLTREKDDFGSENGILIVGESA